ncbi:MAG: ACP S-malonyltransferase [Gracilibacteraceae bacterium]|jgi:[acyl-carrier-protein] S-malonyltransferase|nr:ACP S-malonyltransferase [Gracilibacteraceae bacterium]
MARVALLFAGQGAQYPGMGRELYETSPAARAVFDRAEAERPGLMELCFRGEAAELTETVNAQPGLFCVGLAAAEAAREAGIEAEMAAGFSLGELPALVFAGALSFADGFRLVCLRGELMQTAAASGQPSSMLAVLRLPAPQVDDICRRHAGVYPANYNCPGQTAVSGHTAALPAFSADVKAAGGRTAPLAVSAGFHSPIMTPAADAFRAAFAAITFSPPLIPVYANRTAAPYGAEERDCLSSQIDHPVRWEESIRNMLAAGADTFIEVGPGKTLSGFLRKINPGVQALNIQDGKSLARVKEEFAQANS